MTSHSDYVTTGHVTSDQSVAEEGGDVTENHSSDNTTDNCNHGDSSAAGQRLVRDLHWLVGRMSRLTSYEAGRHPQQSLKVTI